MVVIPDQPGLVRLAQLASVPAAAALITAATGQRPVSEDGAWVWAAVNHASPSIVTTISKFSECTSAGSRGTAAVDAAVACIESKGPFLRIVTEANGLELIRNRLLMTTAADTVAVTRVEFVITGKGISGSLTIPAHRFVDGSLAGWLANTNAMSLPNGNYALRSVAYDDAGTIGRSVDVRMRVDNETSPLLPPVTKVEKPAADAQLSGRTLLHAIASSRLGVSDVEFRITGDGRTIIEKAVAFYGWLADWNTKKRSQWHLYGVQRRRWKHRARHDQQGHRSRGEKLTSIICSLKAHSNRSVVLAKAIPDGKNLVSYAGAAFFASLRTLRSHKAPG